MKDRLCSNTLPEHLNSVVVTGVIFNCVHIHRNCWLCKEVNCGLSFSEQAENSAHSNSFPSLAPDLLSLDLDFQKSPSSDFDLSRLRRSRSAASWPKKARSARQEVDL